MVAEQTKSAVVVESEEWNIQCETDTHTDDASGDAAAAVGDVAVVGAVAVAVGAVDVGAED